MAIRYYLANYLTGDLIREVPVMDNATWALTLDKADSLSCTIDFADPGVAALDPLSITTPRKTILVAMTDDDIGLAWGQIDKRTWDADARTVAIDALGAWDGWTRMVIGTSDMRTAALTSGGEPVTSLDRTFSNVDLATIGKKLMQDRLGWPSGTMPYTFFDDRKGTRTNTYAALDFKSIGDALSDLVARDNGPDFDFGIQWRADRLGFTYPVRAGTEATPLLGANRGAVAMNAQHSPVTGLKIVDDFGDFAVASFAKSQGQDDSGTQITLASRVLNEDLRINGGYPPEDYVDTSHSDVVIQDTLDEYATENATYASRQLMTFSFELMNYYDDGTPILPLLGTYRPGDYLTLNFVDDEYMGTKAVTARITSISGSASDESVTLSCQGVS